MFAGEVECGQREGQLPSCTETCGGNGSNMLEISVYNFSISDKCVCLTDVQKRQEIPALKLDPRWSKMVKWCQIDVKLTQIVRIRFAMFLGTVGRRASSQMKFAILSLGAGRDEQNFQQILVTRSDFRQT